MHDAHVERRRARVGEASGSVADAVGLGAGIEGMLVLEDELERRRIGGSGARRQASLSRARAIISARSACASPNGAQPSASSTARRSERAVRPPIQIGTRGCTAHGSTTKPSYA